MVKTEGGKPTKLEKADILELTVKHLQRLTQRRGSTQRKDPGPESEKGTSNNSCEENAIHRKTSPGVSQEGDSSTAGEANEAATPQGRKLTTGTLDASGQRAKDTEPRDNILQSSENTLEGKLSGSKESLVVKDESYMLGFRKCMNAIDSLMKQNADHPQENVGPRLLQHLDDYFNGLDEGSCPSPSAVLAPIKQEEDEASGSEESPPSRVSEATSTTAEATPAHPQQVTGLTLVPTRLPGGGLAFLVQGGLDPSLLLQTPVSGSDRGVVQKNSVDNLKTSESGSSCLQPSANLSSSRTSPVIPREVSSDTESVSLKIEESKQTSPRSEHFEEKVTNIMKTTSSAMPSGSKILISTPTSSSIITTPVLKKRQMYAKDIGLPSVSYRLPATPQTPVGGPVTVAQTPQSPTTSRLCTISSSKAVTPLPLPNAYSILQLPPTPETPSPLKPELHGLPAALRCNEKDVTPTLTALPASAVAGTSYLASGLSKVQLDFQNPLEFPTPIPQYSACGWSPACPETPSTSHKKFLLPLTPPTPENKSLQPRAPAALAPLPPLGEEEAMEEGEEEEDVDVLRMEEDPENRGIGEVNEGPYDLSLRRMWRPW